MSNSGSAGSLPHPSLPAKPKVPLPSASAFETASHGYTPRSVGPRNYGGNTGGGQTNYGGATAANYRPRSVAPVVQAWPQQSYSHTLSAPPAPSATFSAPPSIPSASQAGYGSYQQQSYQQQPYQQQAAYYPQQSYDSYQSQTSAPQIVNPFAAPVSASAGGKSFGNNAAYDPEYEAQIAQWQSAYMPKDESATSKAFGKKEPLGNANNIPLGTRGGTGPSLSSQEITAAAPADSRGAAVIAGADGKQKTVVRSGGGKTWQDPSLLEWDPAHPRLFIGNLAGEVTDDSLLKAFTKYASVSKARVVRDQRTTKSKGFGFVSFASSDDYFQAAKEMQGKYIGSHPVTIKRSTTEIKAVAPPGKGGKYSKGGKNNKGSKKGDEKGSTANASVGTGAGVKKNAKMKNGMKLLG